ncbi:DUF4435 domain-containing protein [Acinetobacter gyllenbergii]|uniref:DUF4435 domain-containing protein n=1 Tax=Acinetobacter gyllenbergii TaxID=134534 RepID=UPI0003BE06A8|nr:DUF4435 domain-containing protein [Acinetobacter gyllenbergii]ESK56521.1 hypothetical protein F987_00347 [Acinetobacter gyllenbergii NIPH 230]
MTDYIKYFTNGAYLGAYNASKEGTKDAAQKGMVYIEDDSDQVFWERFIDFHFPNKYNITASIKNHPGERGKRSLEKLFYKDANEKALIAVDTDYDLLCPSMNPQYSSYLINNKFILHTFGFSRESALIDKKHLNNFFKTLKHTIQHNIDIDSFLTKLSIQAFKGLAIFSNELNTGNKSELVSDNFHNCFNILNQKIVKDDLTLDEDLLELIEKNLGNYFSNLNYSETTLKDAEIYLSNFGINIENAYRFISGHTIYDLILKIHEQLLNTLFNLEVKKIASDFKGKAISQRKSQLQDKFYSQLSIDAFCHHYPIKDDDEIHIKIKEKISKVAS